MRLIFSEGIHHSADRSPSHIGWNQAFRGDIMDIKQIELWSHSDGILSWSFHLTKTLPFIQEKLVIPRVDLTSAERSEWKFHGAKNRELMGIEPPKFWSLIIKQCENQVSNHGILGHPIFRPSQMYIQNQLNFLLLFFSSLSGGFTLQIAFPILPLSKNLRENGLQKTNCLRAKSRYLNAKNMKHLRMSTRNKSNTAFNFTLLSRRSFNFWVSSVIEWRCWDGSSPSWCPTAQVHQPGVFSQNWSLVSKICWCSVVRIWQQKNTDCDIVSTEVFQFGTTKTRYIQEKAALNWQTRAKHAKRVPVVQLRTCRNLLCSTTLLETYSQWIGFVGKIGTGNPWVFTIKYGVFRLEFSLKPIHWYRNSTTIKRACSIRRCEICLVSGGLVNLRRTPLRCYLHISSLNG